MHIALNIYPSFTLCLLLLNKIHLERNTCRPEKGTELKPIKVAVVCAGENQIYIYVPNSMRRTRATAMQMMIRPSHFNRYYTFPCEMFACVIRCVCGVVEMFFFLIRLCIEMGQRNKKKNSWFYFVVIHSKFDITRAKLLVFILAYVLQCEPHSVLLHAKRVYIHAFRGLFIPYIYVFSQLYT